MATQGLMTSQLADMLQAGMSPEEIRMQMADAKAMEWAKMPTSQKMSYNIGRSVGGFTDSLLNAFGVQQQDPALAKATQLAQIRNEIDPTNEKSIIAGAQKLAQLGFGREAQELATKALATREKESIIAKNLREKEAADPFQKLLEKGVYKPTSLKKFQDSGDPADLEFKDSEAKTSVIKADGRTKLINSQTGEVIADLGAAGKTLEESLGTGLGKLGEAMVGAQAKAAGAEAGKGVGKQSVEVQGKYTAMKSIDDALKMADKGIFAGGYGPTMEAAAKYTKGMVGGQKTLENTEQFRAYIGDVVIPRLQEFGGNDSVEELKYLRSVMAGDTTLETGSIKKILKRAKEKIDEGVKRLEAQQQATLKGEPLPLGPVKGTVKWSDLP